VAFAAFQAVFIHANFAPRLGWLEPFVVTPRLHHLHHASDDDAIDKNFAIHLPILDRVFGTLFAPRGRWARRYGAVGSSLPRASMPGRPRSFAIREGLSATRFVRLVLFVGLVRLVLFVGAVRLVRWAVGLGADHDVGGAWIGLGRRQGELGGRFTGDLEQGFAGPDPDRAYVAAGDAAATADEW
jgi:hypothetical protein